MNLITPAKEPDGVVLAYVRHFATNFNKARSVFENLGFEICDVNQNVDNHKNFTIRLVLNESFIEVSNSFASLSRSNELSGIKTLGFSINDIEATQGRLTLNGFHPLPLSTHVLKISVPNKKKVELETKLFRLKESDMPEASAEFTTMNNNNLFSKMGDHGHKNYINEINAVILCVDDPDEVVARYCWLTNQGSPKRLFERCWQIPLHQRRIIVFNKDELNNLCKLSSEHNPPSILGYSLISKNLQKTQNFLIGAGWRPIYLTKKLLFLELPDSVGGNLFISQDEADFPWYTKK